MRKYLLIISMILGLGLLSLTSTSVAADLDSMIEEAGELGSFGADVLEDFALDGEDAEGSSKARLKDFIKGKSLDWLKGKVTGGDDISAGMDFILKQIYKEVNSEERTTAGRCEPAALNQARTIAFDAMNARLLRGAANVVFDLLTSAIPGAPGLAKKLVESIGTAAYKEIRSQIEAKIKEAWKKGDPELFKYSRQSGPCALSMSVIWNKAKAKYLYIITGSCFCQTVPVWPPYRPEPVPLRSFTVIGGGSITPFIIEDEEAPTSMNIGFALSPKRKKIFPDCNCTLKDSRIEDPTGGGSAVFPEIAAHRSINSGKMRVLTGVKCPACQSLLEVVNEFVSKYNNTAQSMDDIAKRINAEPRKTLARDADEAKWDMLSEQLNEIVAAHDKAFNAFAKCEEEECKDGTDPFVLDSTSEEEPASTSCKECAPEVAAANALVGKYNKRAAEMNVIASVTQKSEVKHGTRTGNTYFRKWQQLQAQLGPLAGQISDAKKAIKICAANKCPSGTLDPIGQPWRPRTGICLPCKPEADAYNDAVKELNAAVDRSNAITAAAAEIEKKHGYGAEVEGHLQENNYHQAVMDYIDAAKKVPRLNRALTACIKEKCQDASGLMRDDTSSVAGPDLDFLMIAPCNRPNNELMGYNPNGTPYYNGTDVNHDFQWYGGGNQHYPNGANIVAFEPDHGAGAQYFNSMRNQKGKINCKKLTINIAIFVDGVFVRTIQEGQEKPQITPNDTYYKFEAKASKKLARGLMKGLGVLQGFGGGGISLGGGGGSKKGTADDQWGLWKVGFTPLDSPSSAWKIETGEGSR